MISKDGWNILEKHEKKKFIFIAFNIYVRTNIDVKIYC